MLILFRAAVFFLRHLIMAKFERHATCEYTTRIFLIPSSKLAYAIGFRFNSFLIGIYHYDERFSINMPNGDSLCYFNGHGSVHRNNLLIYIQQDATLQNLFYLETALRVSGGTITNHQERKQLYLQHLVFVTPLLLSAAIVEELEPV